MSRWWIIKLTYLQVLKTKCDNIFHDGGSYTYRVSHDGELNRKLMLGDNPTLNFLLASLIDMPSINTPLVNAFVFLIPTEGVFP